MQTIPRPQHNCVKPPMVRRYAAFAFDWTLVSLTVGLLPTQSLTLGFLCFVALGSVYFSLMEASSYQGTIGKFLVGIRVEDQHGSRLELPQAATRFFAGTASWATLNIGHLMASWRPDGLTLHDMIAKTRVCQDKNLGTRHHVAVGLMLAFHAITLIVSTVLAVQKALAELSAAGIIQQA